jgi:hypothetical protein
MADLLVQERPHVANAQQGQAVARARREENFCDLLMKIIKVAAPFFISFAAFAFLPAEQAIVVTALVAVATLAYLFRNVGSGTPRSVYHRPAHTYHHTIHHHHHDVGNSDPLILEPLRTSRGFTPSSFSSNYGGSMSKPVGAGFGTKDANPSRVDDGKNANPSNKSEEGKAGNPTTNHNARFGYHMYSPSSGIGSGNSSIGSSSDKSGFGSSGSSASGVSGSGKSGFGASGSSASSSSSGSGKSGFGSSGSSASGVSGSGKSQFGSGT